MQWTTTLCENALVNSSRTRTRLFVATGILLVGGSISSVGAQTQYPITPPVVVSLVPTTTAKPDPSVPAAISASPAAVSATTVPSPGAASSASAVTTIAAPATPKAQVLGESISANPAFTGSNATKPFAFAGVALVGTGAVFVAAGRRRRRRPQA